jgi:hypothetical protein
MTQLLALLISNYSTLYNNQALPLNSPSLPGGDPLAPHSPSGSPADPPQAVEDWEELEEISDFFSVPVPENSENLELCEICKYPIQEGQDSIAVCREGEKEKKKGRMAKGWKKNSRFFFFPPVLNPSRRCPCHPRHTRDALNAKIAEFRFPPGAK